MKASKILAPTDFSHASAGALKVATSLARALGARLLIAHVEEPPLGYGGGEMYVPEINPEDLRARLIAITPTDPNIEFEHHMLTGSPASALAEFAKSEDVDFIVLGTHGRRGISRMLMGSVAETLVRRAPCPVLTFKETVEETEKAAHMFEDA